MTIKRSCMRAIAAIAPVIALLTSAGCGGDKSEPSSPNRSHDAEVARVAYQWQKPGADRVHGGDATARTEREIVADRLIMSSDLLPLGARRETVRKLLGQPQTASIRTWSYIVYRRRPADGYGGWCERHFDITFDKHDRVTEAIMPPPDCPRGVNP
jgi:hypothetical protein